MASFLNAWRVSFARTKADWPIVAAAWVITLLASVLFSAGLIYPSAAAESGLRRALGDATFGSTTVTTTVYAAPPKALELDGQTQAEIDAALAPIGGATIRDWRTTATLALGGLPGSVKGDQALLGYLDDVADHAQLVTGAWPVTTGGGSGAMELAVVSPVADALGLGVGDAVTFVVNPSTNPVEIHGRLAGIFTVTDPSAPYWDADDQLVTGVHENASYRTFGPFLTTIEDLVGQPDVDSLFLTWNSFPRFSELRVDDAVSLRRKLESLEQRLAGVTGVTPRVESGLPQILKDAERSLLVSRTSVLLVMAQMALLAGYAIVLTASLVVDHRRIDTAMLRSRGAGAAQVALLAVVEGLLLAGPAVIVAPWLAAAVLNVFNVVGPLADVGLHIEPRVTADAYLGATIAGLVCVALLVLPAALAARRFAAAQGDLSRQETRTFGQRMGIDIALLTVTGIAIWQLRLYGAPLTRSVQGSLGLDPLLVAAPAIALIAGGVLALRMLPLLAQAVEVAVSRGRSLVISMGSRQLARRPLRYTRAALLLMLAMSMGVFALSYGTTWTLSQRDQAAYQAGADVRVRASRSVDSLPAWAVAGAYADLASASAMTPVERLSSGVTFAAGGSADLLALDAGAAPDLVLARRDGASKTIGELMAPLREARPVLTLPSLPEGAAYLAIVPRVEITRIAQWTYDPDTDETTETPLDPQTVTDIRVSAKAVIRDAHGMLFELSAPAVQYDPDDTVLRLALRPVEQQRAAAVEAAGAHLDGPVEIALLKVEVWMPDQTTTSGAVFGIKGVAASAGADGPWDFVATSALAPMRAGLAFGPNDPIPPSMLLADGTGIRFKGSDEHGFVYGAGRFAPAASVTFESPTTESTSAVVPVIANRALLDGFELKVGDTLIGDLTGPGRRLKITGVVESFPTTDPAKPLLILDQQTLNLLRLNQGTGFRNPDEWWFSAANGDIDTLGADVRASPLHSIDVVTVEDRTRALSTDPVALGIIGALSLGFVATGLFAIIGLSVSTAVAARQRRTEFALLRALGLSGRQLASTLWLENGSLVFVSLVAGTGLGLLIGWLVLPFVTVTQRAASPIPPVIVEVPWDRIAILDVASAIALGVAVIVIGGVLRRLGVGSVLRMGED